MFDSREYEFADIKVNLLGVELNGLRGLQYKNSQEKELVYGQGNEPRAVQRGNKKYEGTLFLLKSDYDMLDRAAVAAGYGSIVDVPGKYINLVAVYAKTDLDGLTTDILQNVEFTEAEDGQKQGDKFKEISLPFIFLRKRKA